MELHHEFTVPVPVQDAWRVLLDIERVAPCMPGATVEDYDGKTITGSVKVKVGPITLTYRGTAVFEEQDEAAHRMVLVASGREARGQGTARATVTGTLSERDGGTAVSVRTDLTVTGRPAQFGRGVMAEVGDKLVGRFADCLSERLKESDRPTEPSGRPEESDRPTEPSGRPEESDRPTEPSGRPEESDRPTEPSGRPEESARPTEPSGRPEESGGREESSGPPEPRESATLAGASGRTEESGRRAESSGRPADSGRPAASELLNKPTLPLRSAAEPIDLVRTAAGPVAKRLAAALAAAAAATLVFSRLRRVLRVRHRRHH
ncbi:SRPBCC domain-containing protein [Streptomyces sp. NPDC058466]|uniref:SRPBCC domain-containing protein n=1 Tax=Streptomyces sp. NPDC058466 TaxID=3346512 RepID=UPI00365F04F4